MYLSIRVLFKTLHSLPYWLISLFLVTGCLSVRMPKDPSSSITNAASSFNHSTQAISSMECKVCHEKNRPVTTPPHGEGNDCKSCHNTTAWKGGTSSFDHSTVTNQACSNCHEKDRPITTPVHGGGADCKTCHVAGTTWLTGVGANNHTPEPATCNACHGPAGIKNDFPTKHIAVNGKDCKACHQASVGVYVDWKGGFFNHSPEPDTCATCHNDAGAHDSFPATHIATQGFDCKSCHQNSVGRFVDWKGGIFNHSPTPNACATCHADGAVKDSFPANHTVPTNGLDCRSCHGASITSGFADWKNGQFSHSPQPAVCATCHGDGKVKDSFPTGHIATQGFDCKSCHQSTLTNYTSWAGGIFNHTPTPAACATCHADGAVKDSFPANHISTNGADCKSCHTATISGGFKDWKNGRFLHNPVPASCASCHAGAGIHPSVPATHIPMNGSDCKSCHNASVTKGFTDWKGGVFTHTSSITACATCHATGAPKNSFPAIHISTQGLDCKSCHQASVTSGYVNWTNAYFTHSASIATCATCHADGKPKDSFPAVHIATQGLDCKSCHQATLATFTNWKNGIFNHNPTPANCGTCHATGAAHNSFPTPSTLHVPVAAGTDCKSCHMASVTGSYANWKNGQYPHNPEPSSCSTCHSTGGLHNSFPATGHLATNGADCKTCHIASVNGGYANWTGGTFAHSTTLIAQKNCMTCHSSDRPSTGRLMRQDPNITSNASHYGQFDCYYCHKTTLAWKDWNSSSTNHYNAAGTKIESCLPCHYSKKSPAFDGIGTARVSPHTNDASKFTLYTITSPAGTAAGASGMLGRCYACHNKGRRSWSQ